MQIPEQVKNGFNRLKIFQILIANEITYSTESRESGMNISGSVQGTRPLTEYA